MTPSLLRIARWLYLAHRIKATSNDALILTVMDLCDLGDGVLWFVQCHCAVSAAVVEVSR
jgi:hypothetical protein